MGERAPQGSLIPRKAGDGTKGAGRRAQTEGMGRATGSRFQLVFFHCFVDGEYLQKQILCFLFHSHMFECLLFYYVPGPPEADCFREMRGSIHSRCEPCPLLLSCCRRGSGWLGMLRDFQRSKDKTTIRRHELHMEEKTLRAARSTLAGNKVSREHDKTCLKMKKAARSRRVRRNTVFVFSKRGERRKTTPTRTKRFRRKCLIIADEGLKDVWDFAKQTQSMLFVHGRKIGRSMTSRSVKKEKARSSNPVVVRYAQL